MRINRPLMLLIIAAALAGAWALSSAGRKDKNNGYELKEVAPFVGPVKTYISCTGTVLPKNRLEIMPPVAGRIESIAVKEGDMVKAGQTLAMMSSTERAALLDAARGKGEAALKYWQETYKPIPLLAPIDGQVIVATTQPGQTVTTSGAVVVLSDRLIVRAQVDETDIGKIALGTKALVALDAYPDTGIGAVVQHIYYESETSNNVTIYKVDLVPESVPAFFRSGMNANIDFVVAGNDKALLVPVEAVMNGDGHSYVLLKQENGGEPLKTRVVTGIIGDKEVEVVSGITAEDRILMKVKKYSLPQKDSGGSNPFMPSRKKK